MYDPLNDISKSLTPIDDPHFLGLSIRSQCAAVNKKLVLVTGVLPSSRTMKRVYIYDFQSAKWSRGADMHTPRCAFASCVSSSTGLIYVAGGVDGYSNPLATAETYNVEEDKWEILTAMTQPRSLGFQVFFIEGKFMVISRHPFDRSAEFFDPTVRTWRSCEDMWIS